MAGFISHSPLGRLLRNAWSNGALIAVLVLLLGAIAATFALVFARTTAKRAKEKTSQPQAPESESLATRACYHCGRTIRSGSPVYHVYVQDQGPYEEMLMFICEECYLKGLGKPG